MKQLFFFSICIFPSLFINAQDQWSKADVGITSISLVAHPPGPASIMPPDNKAPQTDVRLENSGTKLPARQQELPFKFKCRIIVQNDNNDLAYKTKLMVVLPAHVNAEAITYYQDATKHKIIDTSPFTSYFEFNLWDMAAGQTATLEFVFTRPLNVPVQVSAYIFSATPDPNPLNNYKNGSY